MEEKKAPGDGDHEERVQSAFDALHEKLGDRLTDDARASVDRLRAAASEKDAAALRGHLAEMKESDSWLYRELAAHPQIASLINELAVWGF